MILGMLFYGLCRRIMILLYFLSYILGLRNEYIWMLLTDALIIFLVCSIVFGFGRKKCNFLNKYNFRFKRCAKRECKPTHAYELIEFSE